MSAKIRVLTILAFVISVFLVAPRVEAGELFLNSQLMLEINGVLKASDTLHRSLIQQNEEQVELGLRDLIQQINRARELSYLAKPHERQHLIRILDAAKEHFEITQTSFGSERRDRLEDGFNQLVNLVRIYKVDRSYAIYFCPKDKSTWVQTSAKAQNPFRTEAGNREPCGIKVPK